MESPKLVQWCPSDNDGPDFFECELGGMESSFENVELTEDDFYTLFKLLQQRLLLLEVVHRQLPKCNMGDTRTSNDKEIELNCVAKSRSKEMTELDKRNDNEKTSGRSSNRIARFDTHNSSSISSSSWSSIVNEILTSWSEDLQNREVSALIVLKYFFLPMRCNLRLVLECTQSHRCMWRARSEQTFSCFDMEFASVEVET